MQTKQKIRQYLAEHRQATGSELSEFLEISDRAVRKQLTSLLEMGEVAKKGMPPKVYYFLIDVETKIEVVDMSYELAEIVEKNYLIVTPGGKRLNGMKGFEYWCAKTKQSLTKTIDEYVTMQQKFEKYKMRNGLIDGKIKLKNALVEVFLDSIYYLDFYSIDRFGKTKLGQLILLAKQGQNKGLMREIIQIIKPRINYLIKKYNISAIGFVPPTVKRQVQLMNELKKLLKLKLEEVVIEKVRSNYLVPQKTLSKLADRIENARDTMVVRGEAIDGDILLIDDAVGSGATLNEIAKQMRERGMVKGKIIGLAIVGSYKGFDVISEV